MSDFPTRPEYKVQLPMRLEWGVPNSIEKASEVQQNLEAAMTERGWSDIEAYPVSYAFYELLINAIVHGNLGLKKPKGGQETDFSNTIQSAATLKVNEHKTVTVVVLFFPDKIQIEIQDQGVNSPEFWKNNTEDMRTGSDTSWQSGRGIQFSEKFLDTLRYEKNKTGVKVTGIKIKK